MNQSRSTPRLRLTALLLTLVVVATALSHRGPVAAQHGQWWPWLGYALVVLAVLGRVWTSSFIAGRKDRELVTAGPYALCRHPLYSLQWLALLGLGLATRSIALTLLLTLLPALLFWRAGRAEDAWLAEHHPQQFPVWAAATPAFLPRRYKLEWPAELQVHPMVYAKSFVDAASLLGVYGLIRVADLLQLAGHLPTVFYLP